MSDKSDDWAGIGCGLIIFVFCFAAWITHVVVCFQHNHWGFLIAGALAFPVAIVHGMGIWFGWWAP